MFYTYIIRSLKDGGYYYGHTSSLENRILSHNAGKVKSTKGRRPLKIHYFEKYKTRQDAIMRERYFKTIDGYKWLKEQNITD